MNKCNRKFTYHPNLHTSSTPSLPQILLPALFQTLTPNLSQTLPPSTYSNPTQTILSNFSPFSSHPLSPHIIPTHSSSQSVCPMFFSSNTLSSCIFYRKKADKNWFGSKLGDSLSFQTALSRWEYDSLNRKWRGWKIVGGRYIDFQNYGRDCRLKSWWCVRWW